MTLTGIAGDILDKYEEQIYGTTISGTTNRPYKKSVTLTFYRAVLLREIKNIAYVEADILPSEDNGHDKHHIFDICEEGNVERVNRIMDLAVAHCKELLFPYSKTDATNLMEINNNSTAQSDYRIILLVPDDISETTLNYLHKLICELVVCKVLADWMGIANIKNVKSAEKWQLKCAEIEEDIISARDTRMRRVRRPLTPF